ncbi:unnamed protein product, partial [Didymodactylos carnosus]
EFLLDMFWTKYWKHFPSAFDFESQFHDLTVDYERVRDKVVKHDETENQNLAIR